MTTKPLTDVRGFRGIAGATLRWITAFDPFGSYAPALDRR
jgi:hypothetical protein